MSDMSEAESALTLAKPQRCTSLHFPHTAKNKKKHRFANRTSVSQRNSFAPPPQRQSYASTTSQLRLPSGTKKAKETEVQDSTPRAFSAQLARREQFEYAVNQREPRLP